MKSASDQDQGLLNIKQAAQLLNVSAVSLRRWTDSGRLPCMRVGGRRERRFRRADLLAFIDQRPAAGPAAEKSPAGSVARIALEGVAIDYGSHLCAIYESGGGRAKLAVPFLADGLGAGDACYLIASPPVQQDLLGALERLRPGLSGDLAEGHLVLCDGKDGGPAMYDFLEQQFVSVTSGGGRSLRVLGDMSWFLDRGLTVDELTTFEMRFDRMLGHSYPVVSLCLYDARRFSGVGILRALKCHEDTFRLPLSRFLVP